MTKKKKYFDINRPAKLPVCETASLTTVASPGKTMIPLKDIMIFQ
jgi:hypothetical protein